jgi:putative tryptophan/tyrosine transport system substrate-binding protein
VKECDAAYRKGRKPVKRREFLATLAGASVLLPVGAGAQQSTKIFRIAMVHPSYAVLEMTEASSLPYYRVFFDELRRLGYVEGHNLLIERYSAEGHVEDYPALARSVVSHTPDLIFTVGAPMAKALKKETSSIPIVLAASDPVAEGLANSLARPAGNITGASTIPGLEIWGRRLQLFREVVPTISKVGVLDAVGSGPEVTPMLRNSAKVEIPVVTWRVDDASDAEYRRGFDSMSHDGADALFVSPATENIAKRQLIVELAARYRLPAMYPYRLFVEAGGLLSYGPDAAEILRYCARTIDKILKGTKPGEIPYYLPTKFELVINLGTAKGLGLTIPSSVLSLADDLIE